MDRECRGSCLHFVDPLFTGAEPLATLGNDGDTLRIGFDGLRSALRIDRGLEAKASDGDRLRVCDACRRVAWLDPGGNQSGNRLVSVAIDFVSLDGLSGGKVASRRSDDCRGSEWLGASRMDSGDVSGVFRGSTVVGGADGWRVGLGGLGGSNLPFWTLEGPPQSDLLASQNVAQ